MDDFIHDKEKGLAKFISYGLSSLWLVYEDSDIVAFFSLSKDSLILNNTDIENINNNKSMSEVLPDKNDEIFWEQEKFPAVEIDYLAVCKNKKYKHLGSYIIEIIAHQVQKDQLSATMFLTVEAYHSKDYSTITFYTKCGFKNSEHGMVLSQNKAMFGEIPTTQRMYKLLLPE